MVEDSALQVSWPGDLERDKELFEGVLKANKVLGEELGLSRGFVTAAWKMIPNSHNLELSLTDQFTKSQVIEKFTPEEFRNEIHLGNCFHRMWGHLLRTRSDRQIKKLEELVTQEEGA